MAANQYVIKSAQRTLEVLMAFASAPHKFGLAELQQSTGIEKNQLYRSLKTLEAAGFLVSDHGGRYVVTDLVSGLLPALPGVKAATARPRRSPLAPRTELHKSIAAD